MRLPALQGIFFIWFVGNLFSLMLEAAWLGTDETTLAQQLLGYSITDLQGPGVVSIVKAGTAVFTTALPKVLFWDFAFFEGDWFIIRMFLIFTLSGPLLIKAAEVFITAAQGVFSRFL